MIITVHDLKTKLDAQEELILLDVREQYEFDEFNLDGQLIPLGEFMNALPDLEDKKDAQIVVHCRSGKRSAIAQEMLLEAGFKNVKNLQGGVVAWIEAFGA